MMLASRPPPDLDEFKELLFRCAREFVQIRDWSQEVYKENKQLVAALQANAQKHPCPDQNSDEEADMQETSSLASSHPQELPCSSDPELSASCISFKDHFCPGKEAHHIDETQMGVAETQDVSKVSPSALSHKTASPKAKAQAVLTNLAINPRVSAMNARRSAHNGLRSSILSAGSGPVLDPTNPQHVRQSMVAQSFTRALPHTAAVNHVEVISSRQSRTSRTLADERDFDMTMSEKTVDTASASKIITLQPVDLIEMQQHKELEKWFLQMNPVGGLYLTPKMIQQFTIANSDSARSLDWIQSVMLDLNQHTEMVLQIPVETESLSEENPHYNMHFSAFCELIQWHKLELVEDQMAKRRILEVRAAIIRNSVDRLIYKHTHLEMPKVGDVNSLKRPWEQVLDIIVGFAIVLNAITIGISADHPWAGFQVSELLFTALFFFEIILKLMTHGFRRQFGGPDYLWNIFDVVIVVLAIFDAGMSYIVGAQNDLGNATIIRLARLARLTRLMRLLRLLRLRIFKELLLMVKGVVAGLRTLFWAIVLLVFVVYVVGLLLRQTVGEDDLVIANGPYDTKLFQTVGWSMFSVFRCFTEDCTLQDGTPIVGHLYEAYGWKFVFPYAIIMLFITFGIFNLIMAIFVENVMESARQKRQLTESTECTRVVRRLRELVLKFGGTMELQVEVERTEHRLRSDVKHTIRSVASIVTGSSSLEGRTDKTRTLTSMASHCFKSDKTLQTYIVEAPLFQFGGQISREMFQSVMYDQEAQELLEDLEIHVGDRSELFDVLDADGSGFLDVSELIAGLLKLRSGGADKSDVVAAILGIRSLHKTFTNFMQLALENQRTLHAKAENHEQMLEEHLEEMSRQIPKRSFDKTVEKVEKQRPGRSVAATGAERGVKLASLVSREAETDGVHGETGRKMAADKDSL